MKTIHLSDYSPISISLILGGKISKDLWSLNSNILKGSNNPSRTERGNSGFSRF